MSVLRAKRIAFSDATWTTAGDATIVDGVLTVTSPIDELPFNVRNWNTVPDYSTGLGGYPMAPETVYLATTPTGDHSEDDVTFCVYVKLAKPLALNLGIEAQLRRGGLPTTYVTAAIYGNGGTNKRLQIKNSDGGTVAIDTETSGAYAAFRRVWCVARGQTVRIVVEANRELAYKIIDKTAAGAVAIAYTGIQTDAVVIGGSPGESPDPYLAVKREGTATMKTTATVKLPPTFQEFDRVSLSYNAENDTDGDQRRRITVRTKIYDKATGAWGAWQSVAADGDMSAIDANPGDECIFELSLDNAADLIVPFTTWPALDDITLTWWEGHEGTAMTMETLLGLIKQEIDGDTTITSHPDWPTNTGATIFKGRNAPPIPDGSIMVYISRGQTDRPIEAAGRKGDRPVQTVRVTHNVHLWPTVLYRTTDVGAVHVKEGVALEWLVETVKDLFSVNGLNGHLGRNEWIEVGDITEDQDVSEEGATTTGCTHRIDLRVFVGVDVT